MKLLTIKTYLPLALLALAACNGGTDDSASTNAGAVDGERGQSTFETDQGDGSFAETRGCIDSDVVGEVMTKLINEARAVPQQCGDVTFPAVAALDWSERAEAAAADHSEDMAANSLFSHSGSNGSNVGDRVTAQNYQWSAVAENLAFGYGTPESAMQGWMTSEGHCANIMSANVTEVGVSCADSPGEDSRRYWTQVLAKPNSQ